MPLPFRCRHARKALSGGIVRRAILPKPVAFLTFPLLLGTGQKLEGGGGGRAGAFLFWPTSFGETFPIPGAEKMLTPQNSLHNLSWLPKFIMAIKGYLYCSIARIVRH